MISKKEISELADLCKLSPDDIGREDFLECLQEVINLFDKIKDVDVEGVEPTYQVNDYKEPFTDDIVKESLPQEEVLKNTEEEKYGYFKILKVVD